MTFCETCGVEMVKAERVAGDPALDCSGDCWGCVAPLEGNEHRVISREAYPGIYDALAEVYGGTTVPLDLDATDLGPLRHTADGTPL